MSHTERAAAAEEIGELDLAIAHLREAVRADPGATDAWAALARLHEELGNTERAEACRTRAGGAPVGPVEESSGDADLLRFLDLFSGRQDVHAAQWCSGDGSGYAPVRRPLGLAELRSHLDGRETLGIYLVRRDQTCSVLCLDLDVTAAAQERAWGDRQRTRDLAEVLDRAGRDIRDRLRGLGLDPVLEDSGGRGRHLWCFLPADTPAARVHDAARGLGATLDPGDERLSLEGFPKQGRVKPGGLGNLVKLPLGVHRRSSRRCPLLGEDGAASASPFALLRRVARTAIPDLPPAPPARGRQAPPAPPTVTPAADEEWALADFERSRTVGPVLEGCVALRRVVERILATRRVERDESVVLNHSLGHLQDGARAANYLYAQVPGFPESERVKGLHKGSPVSCKRIRARLPADCASGCDCRFAEVAGQYPHPLRHLDGVSTAAPMTLDVLLSRYARQVELAAEARRQEDRLRAEVVRRMAALPGRRWETEEGTWALGSEDDSPVLSWEPS